MEIYNSPLEEWEKKSKNFHPNCEQSQ